MSFRMPNGLPAGQPHALEPHASPDADQGGEPIALSHVDSHGSVRMVDVSAKSTTQRTATARSLVFLGRELMAHLDGGEIVSRKGPVFQTAVLAGIMAAKRTDELIPLCHSLGLDACDVVVEPHDDETVRITATVRTAGRTGVEMEALVACSVAALTVYDMCKAAGHHIVVKETLLLEKTGGRNDFQRARR